MTIEEMKQLKKERGYSYAQMAELSGVPLGTIQKIFCGETLSPRYDTLQAIEKIFVSPGAGGVKETQSFYGTKYTIEDYRSLPEERRVELIDGYFYDMSAPTTLHQRIVMEITRQISNYILDRQGACEVFVSPVDVQLDCDEMTMMQPDVIVVCDTKKIKKWGIYGAPDFVLEVLSTSTRKKDCFLKLMKYQEAGVREYWVIDPAQGKLLVYQFETNSFPTIYGMDASIPMGIYQGKLQIDMKHIKQWIDKENADDSN